MAWKKGPLPKDTYNWGGVVPYENQDGTPHTGTGFFFADFWGDKVRILNSDGSVWELKPHEVKYYDNSLELPPND